MIGQTVSHFKILSKLGAGGMGEVYLAEDTALARRVALKFLAPQYTADSELEARFKREAKAAAALNHPNIVVVHEIGEHDGQTYIAMEYVEGQSLRDRIGQGALPVEEVLNIVSQICEGLQKAHEAGIVHRDLKPENILIDKDARVRIVDFGLARLGGATKLTRESSTLGTLHYMSPEQFQGQEVDHRADIWAFGVLLYEMLTGKVPFAGDYPAAVMYAVINEEPEALKTHLQFQSLLDTALSKSIESRFQQVSDLLAQLKSLQEPTTASHESVPIKSGVRFKPAWFFASFMVLLLAIVLILWRLGAKDETSSSFQQMQITRLSNTGNVQEVAISPDGKYIAEIVSEQGMSSLWLRQIGTSGSVQLISSSNVTYSGLAFSSDGSYIYYVIVKKGAASGTLYRLPSLGGIASPVTTGDYGDAKVTFSPDGKRMAFVRQKQMQIGGSKLIIANADGTEERILATREVPDGFSPKTYSWSPDGRSIAISDFVLKTDGRYRISILEIQIEDGAEKLIVEHDWLYLSTLAWLPDGNGLILSGADDPATFSLQLSHISYPSGDIERITNDLNHYRFFSLTEDATTLAAVVGVERGDVWVTGVGEFDQAQKIASISGSVWMLGAGLSWTHDNRIVYASAASGNYDIWIMNKDGSNKRQLTSHISYDRFPMVSSNGQKIVFDSGRDGMRDLWTMDIEGSNLRQLTKGLYVRGAAVSRDSVIFVSSKPGAKPSLVTIPINGGKPIVQTLDRLRFPLPSPDGQRTAFFWSDDSLGRWQIGVTPVDGSKPQKILGPDLSAGGFRWSPDRKDLIYGKKENLWRLPLDGSSPEQITQFTEGEIWAFAYSRDGKYLAYTRGRTYSDAVVIRNFL